MGTKRVKILVFYKIVCDVTSTLKERLTTTFIIDESYLFQFLPFLIREDIDRVEVKEYEK